jgi:hypothetical protein
MRTGALRSKAVLAGSLIGISGVAMALPASAVTSLNDTTSSTPPPSPITPTTQVPVGASTAPMTVQGLNATVAEAHGYVVKTLADGTEVSIASATFDALGSDPSDQQLLDAAAATWTPTTSLGSVHQPASTSAYSHHRDDRVYLDSSYSDGRVYLDGTVVGDCGISFLTMNLSGTTPTAYWYLRTGYIVTGPVAYFGWTTTASHNNSHWKKDYTGTVPNNGSWSTYDGARTNGAGNYYGVVSAGFTVLDSGSYCVSGDPSTFVTKS